MKELVIGSADEGSRLDRYLIRYLPKAPSGFVYKMLRKKNITRNGKKADGSERLYEGDVIRLFLADDTIAGFLSGAMDKSVSIRLEVCYEDEQVLIVNKPAGMLTQGDRSGDPSLSDALIGYLREKQEVTEESIAHFRPSPANRLDRNTSGLVLCGKNLAGQQMLSVLLREKQVRKFYLTAVHGVFSKELSVTSYLVKDPAKNRVSVSDRPLPNSELVRTTFRPVFIGEHATLLEAELHTGKAHQIRAQAAHLKFPLLGDVKYGAEPVRGYRGHLLHCYRIRFPELPGVPGSLRGRTVAAPVPESMRKVLDRYGLTIPKEFYDK